MLAIPKSYSVVSPAGRLLASKRAKRLTERGIHVVAEQVSVTGELDSLLQVGECQLLLHPRRHSELTGGAFRGQSK